MKNLLASLLMIKGKKKRVDDVLMMYLKGGDQTEFDRYLVSTKHVVKGLIRIGVPAN